MKRLLITEIKAIKETLEVTGDWVERGYFSMAVANLRAMADYLERTGIGDPNAATSVGFYLNDPPPIDNL